MSYTLDNTLYNIIHSYRYKVHTFTKYRNTYVVVSKKSLIPLQKQLEHFRPTIDYILLPNGNLLIGLSKNYQDLKQNSLELMTKTLVDVKKEELKIMQGLLEISKHYKTGKPYHEIFPELFI